MIRVNNVSVDTSFQPIVKVLGLLLYILLIGIFVIIAFTQTEIFSTGSMLQKLSVIFVFIAPFIFVAWIIKLINKRHEALNCMDLKYVDFWDGIIHFCFQNPKYNISCGYRDIENLEMELHTFLVRNKYGTFTAVGEIELHFTLLNGKHLSLHNTPLNRTKYIYKILYYMRNVKSFSYRFSGAGVVDDIKERIEDYLKTGCKQILSTPQENIVKGLSMVLFAVWVYVWWIVYPYIKIGDFVPLVAFGPFLLFILVVFVLDGYLIVDKINDRKFNIYHKSDEFISKIPCELIAGVQLLILLLVIFVRYYQS